MCRQSSIGKLESRLQPVKSSFTDQLEKDGFQSLATGSVWVIGGFFVHDSLSPIPPNEVRNGATPFVGAATGVRRAEPLRWHGGQRGSASTDDPRATPKAAVETEPVPSQGDAADDPAIWIHPNDPRQSLVLGTDKKGGLNVFDLEGRRIQLVSDGSRPNNVDVLYGFPLDGRTVDLVVAGTRSRSRPGIAFWQIVPDSRRLTEVGTIPAFTVFDGAEPYGSCVYKSPRNQAFYVFVTSKDGAIEQYRLDASGRASIRATRVRAMRSRLDRRGMCG